MTCHRCETELPVGAKYCHACGADPVRADEKGGGRRHSFAAQPGQPLISFDVVSSMMPLASDTAPQTYRTALLAGTLVPTIFVLLGWLPSAFVAAALIVPVVYLVYIYDVNEWEDQPVPVIVGTVGAAAVLSLGFTLLWSEVLLGEGTVSRTGSSWQWGTVLITCLLVPVVGELLRQVGPLVLSRMPKFDDLIDSITFAIAAGATFAAMETIVLNRAMITGPSDLDGGDTLTWWILLINAGVLKPIIYGSASAIAISAFSGIGDGYDGFSSRYVVGLGEAMLYGIVFQLGLYTGDQVGGQSGALLSLGVAVLVALVVIVRVRLALHNGLMEAALEAARNNSEVKHAAHGEAWCAHCEMPLLAAAAFCSACGAAVRAAPKQRRAFNESEPAHAGATEGGH